MWEKNENLLLPKTAVCHQFGILLFRELGWTRIKIFFDLNFFRIGLIKVFNEFGLDPTIECVRFISLIIDFKIFFSFQFKVKYYLKLHLEETINAFHKSHFLFTLMNLVSKTNYYHSKPPSIFLKHNCP